MPASNPATVDPRAALERALRALAEDPAEAAAQAADILAEHPRVDPARLILAAAQRRLGDPARALATIVPLADGPVPSADVLHEQALCLGALGRSDEAIDVLRRALELAPEHAGAWRTLGDQLSAAGDEAGAEQAYLRHLAATTRHPELIEAAEHLARGRLPEAERLTRAVLKKDPVDPIAIRLLAGIGMRVGQFDDAINLLERCLELAPDFHLARQNYALALSRRQRLDEALAEVEKLERAEPNNPNYRLLRGSLLVKKGDHAEALELYEAFLGDYPRQAGAHLNHGHTLKTVGRLDEAVAAYRTAIDLRPATGEAYWSLANLKTFRFDDADVERMRGQLSDSGDPDDQAHLSFALGKALEDRERFDEAFESYDRGNRIRRREHRHDPRINVYDTARQLKTLTPEFFAARRGWGSPAPDPIFIVGLPRAGSTLLEQILASHSQVEGTAELPDIIAISRRLGQRSRKSPAGRYPEILTELSADQVRALGEGYLESTRIQRHHDRPFFIDKMPNNFQHVGLIHLILPNARIIDARRHPLAGCFSCYKQLFARGQTFTYSLTDLGHYYRDYVRLMDHWDEVLPGRVLRVEYEDMVSDTEAQIRRLLAYCGLEFEEQCVRFYETERAVRTPSSEQVRRPIYQEGLEQWRNFEAHLEPLKRALGPVLERYPVD